MSSRGGHIFAIQIYTEIAQNFNAFGGGLSADHIFPGILQTQTDKKAKIVFYLEVNISLDETKYFCGRCDQPLLQI